jgi:hypothetical protein
MSAFIGIARFSRKKWVCESESHDSRTWREYRTMAMKQMSKGIKSSAIGDRICDAHCQRVIMPMWKPLWNSFSIVRLLVGIELL